MPTVIALLLFVMSTAAQAEVSTLDYQVISQRNHPNKPFTQGLLIDQGYFYESSGLYGRSYLQRYPIEEGEPDLLRRQPRGDFVEGLAKAGQHFWLLTWQQGLARKLDAALNPIGQANYSSEGWGLAFDGKQLIMSDGSAQLSLRAPNSFAPMARLRVSYNNRPLPALNELEFAHGRIWANVWFDQAIYAIDPSTGKVVAKLDLTALVAKEQSGREAVLNGIAYNPQDDSLWVTGKHWAHLYQLRLTRWP